MSTTDILGIKPIKLLQGDHADTGVTGQGCFMNVIAYLNGEPQITDGSPCVCVYVRRMAIRLNDGADDEQRQRMLPFVLRAMGSATEDEAVMQSRRLRLRQYGAECYALMQAFKRPSRRSINRLRHANASAYAYACADARTAARKLKAALFDAGLSYLDDVLPQIEACDAVVVERMNRLAELQGVA